MNINLKEYCFQLLKWAERYAKTDLVYIVHGGSWLVLAQAATALSSFGLTILLANLLPPAIFGEYRFLLTGFFILSAFALPGMQSALLESTPKGYKKNILIASKEMMYWGLLGSIISLGIAFYYFQHQNLELAFGFIVIAIAIPCFNASEAYLYYLKSLKEFKKVSQYTIITRVIILIISGAAAMTYPSFSWVILFAFLFGQIIPNVFLHKHVTKMFVSTHDVSDKELSRYAKHLSAMGLLGLIAIQIDKIFIWEFVGAGELALFYVAYTIPAEIKRFLEIIPTLAFPKFATKSAAVVRSTLMSKLILFSVGIALINLVYIILAPFLFSLLFPQYINAVPYSQVLILTTFSATVSLISTQLTAHKETTALYTVSILIPIVYIGSALILIPVLGIWGAVWAVIVEAVTRALLLLFFFYRKSAN